MLPYSGTFYRNLFQIFKFYNEFGIHYSSSARVGKSQKMQKFVNNLILVGLVQCCQTFRFEKKVGTIQGLFYIFLYRFFTIPKLFSNFSSIYSATPGIEGLWNENNSGQKWQCAKGHKMWEQIS